MLLYFITLWIGKEYILEDMVVIVLLANFYITTMRMCIDKFKESGGLYYEDRYAPIFEVTINLIFSIILVKKIGLVGVFLGTLISNLSVIFWVKPKIVFNKVFKRSLTQYIGRYIYYLAIGIVPLVLTRFIDNFINIENVIFSFLVEVILNVVVINLTYLIIFHRSEEFLYYKGLVLKKLGMNKNKKLE